MHIESLTFITFRPYIKAFCTSLPPRGKQKRPTCLGQPFSLNWFM